MSTKQPDRLSDARFVQALQHAPDADLQPEEGTRQTIVHAARQAVENEARLAPAPKPETPFWKRFLPGKPRMPWNAGFVTTLLVGLFVAVVWRNQDSGEWTQPEPSAPPPLAQTSSPPLTEAKPGPEAEPAQPSIRPESAPVYMAPLSAEAPGPESVPKPAAPAVIAGADVVPAEVPPAVARVVPAETVSTIEQARMQPPVVAAAPKEQPAPEPVHAGLAASLPVAAEPPVVTAIQDHSRADAAAGDERGIVSSAAGAPDADFQKSAPAMRLPETVAGQAATASASLPAAEAPAVESAASGSAEKSTHEATTGGRRGRMAAASAPTMSAQRAPIVGDRPVPLTAIEIGPWTALRLGNGAIVARQRIPELARLLDELLAAPLQSVPPVEDGALRLSLLDGGAPRAQLRIGKTHWALAGTGQQEMLGGALSRDMSLAIRQQLRRLGQVVELD